MNDFVKALNRLFVVLSPKRCEFCGEVIEFNQHICQSCKNLPRIKQPICYSCGYSKEDCRCKGNKNEYNKIVAPYYYSDRVVTAIHRYKEADMTFLTARFTSDITKCIKENYADIKFDAVAFVPMWHFDKLKRGYNQSEILAKAVSEAINVTYVDILSKTQYTKPQKRRSAKERKANVYGVFDVKDKEFVNGKAILLIDDVKTTGSTLNECAKMLKIYGAKSVYCATLAVVNRHKYKCDSKENTSNS